MYSLVSTNQFKKDYKLCKSRKYKMQLLQQLFFHLEVSGNIPGKYKPHRLSGNYKEFWECHIRPDWLLIWFKDENLKEISLVRTGTHADLF